MESSSSNLSSILYASFNQDASCYAIGTETGFIISSTSSPPSTYIKKMNGGIGNIEMLSRTNIIALIGGGNNPKYSLNKVAIWDDDQEKVIAELRFISYVKNVRLKEDKIFVVCEQKIYIFTLLTNEHIETILTYENQKGLISISTDEEKSVLAYPFKELGKIGIKDCANSREIIIPAHESMISYISLSHDGSLLASSGEKGTIIRLFQTRDGKLLQEFRRGSEKAEIFSIVFDSTNNFIAVSSDRNTIHVFHITYFLNLVEGSSPIKNILGIFGVKNSIDRNFCQFKINESKAICSFGKDNTVCVISSEGKFYKFEFNPRKEGEIKKLEERNIFEEIDN